MTKQICSRDYLHPELAFALHRTGPLGIVVWNGVPSSDAVFEQHCITFGEWTSEDGPMSVVLNVANDFTPSAAQRRIVAERAQSIGLPSVERIAIITDSALARGALFVMAWLSKTPTVSTRGFRPAEIANAVAWLAESTPFDTSHALAAVASARTSLISVSHQRHPPASG